MMLGLEENGEDYLMAKRSSKVVIPINSLSGGVGRTPPSKRQLNEAQELDNCIVTIEKSLEKRNGFKFIDGTVDEDSDRDGALNIPLLSANDDVHFDWLDLDGSNRFLIAINSSSTSFENLISVFKIDDNGIVTEETVDTTVENASDFYDYVTYAKEAFSTSERLKTIPFGSSLFILNNQVEAGYEQGFPGEDITYLTSRYAEGGEIAEFKTTINVGTIGNINNFRSLIVTWDWVNETLSDIESTPDELKTGSFSASLEAITFTDTAADPDVISVNYPRTTNDIVRSLLKDLLLNPPGGNNFPFEPVSIEIEGTTAEAKIVFKSTTEYKYSMVVTAVEGVEDSTTGPGFTAALDVSESGSAHTSQINVDKDIRTDDVLGQSVQNFSKIPLPPASDDNVNLNGAETVLAEIAGETGSTAGYGKVFFTRESFGTTPSAYYRTISTDKQPFFERIRSQDGNCLFDKKKMPIILDYVTTENKWVVKYPTWKTRTSGNKISNKGPLVFEDGAKAKITDMCIWRNRLWFASDDTVFSSASNDYFNLWLDDPDNIVDTDPIDIRAGAEKSSTIASMVPFKDYIFVNTLGDTQYEVVGSENQISPFTAKLAPSSFYSTEPLIDPVPMGSQIYFFSPYKLFLYFSSSSATVNQAIEVSKHAEGYLPKEISLMEALPNKDMIIMVDKVFYNTMYVYINRWEGDRVAQNAFFKWTLPSNSKVLSVREFDNEIFITVARTWYTAFGTNPRTSIFLQRMNMNTDPETVPRMDRRSVSSDYLFSPEGNIAIIPELYVTYATITELGEIYTGQADFFEWEVVNEGAISRRFNASISSYNSDDNFIEWEGGEAQEYLYNPEGTGYELLNSGSLAPDGTLLDRTTVFHKINEEKLKVRYNELCNSCDETIMFENEIVFEDITDPDNIIEYRRKHRFFVNQLTPLDTCPYGNTPGSACCPEGTYLAGFECTTCDSSECDPYGVCEDGPSGPEGCCDDGLSGPCCCGGSEVQCPNGDCSLCDCPEPCNCTGQCGCECDPDTVECCPNGGGEPPCCPNGSAAQGESCAKFNGCDNCPCADGSLPLETGVPCCVGKNGDILGPSPCCLNPSDTYYLESCASLGCPDDCCCCDSVDDCYECDNQQDPCSGGDQQGKCPDPKCGCEGVCPDGTCMQDGDCSCPSNCGCDYGPCNPCNCDLGCLDHNGHCIGGVQCGDNEDCPEGFYCCFNSYCWPDGRACLPWTLQGGPHLECSTASDFFDYDSGPHFAVLDVYSMLVGGTSSVACSQTIAGVPTCHTDDCISDSGEDLPQGGICHTNYLGGLFCNDDCSPYSLTGDDSSEYYRKVSHWLDDDNTSLSMTCSGLRVGSIGSLASGSCWVDVHIPSGFGPPFVSYPNDDCFTNYIDFPYEIPASNRKIVLNAFPGTDTDSANKVIIDWKDPAFENFCEDAASQGEGLLACGATLSVCGTTLSNRNKGPSQVFAGPIKLLRFANGSCQVTIPSTGEPYLVDTTGDGEGDTPMYYSMIKFLGVSYHHMVAKNIRPCVEICALAGCINTAPCNSISACCTEDPPSNNEISFDPSDCECGKADSADANPAASVYNPLFDMVSSLYGQSDSSKGRKSKTIDDLHNKYRISHDRKTEQNTRAPLSPGSSYQTVQSQTTYTENVILGEIPSTKDTFLRAVLEDSMKDRNGPFKSFGAANYLGRLYSGPQLFANSVRHKRSGNDKNVAWRDSLNIPPEVEKMRGMTIGKYPDGTVKGSNFVGYSFTIQYSSIYMGSGSGSTPVPSFPGPIDNNSNYDTLSSADGRSFIQLPYHNPNIFEVVLGNEWEGVGDYRPGQVFKCYNYSYGAGYARYEIDESTMGVKVVGTVGDIEGDGSPKRTVLELIGINDFLLPPYAKEFIDYGSITDSSTDTNTSLLPSDLAYDSNYVADIVQYNQLDCGTLEESLDNIGENLYFVYDFGIITNNATFLKQDFIIGENFRMRAMLSPPTYRDQNNNTIEGVFKVLTMNTRHFNTGKYRLNVYKDNAIVSSVLNSPPKRSKIFGIDPFYEASIATEYQGEFTQKVFLNANDCFITITSNTPDPVNITNIELNGTFVPRKRSSAES